MKLHLSGMTTSCPIDFVFLAFRPYWSSSQKRISGLSAPYGESYTVEMPKVALWKACSEMMPVHHFATECQDAWGCWEPAAPAGARSQELWDGDSNTDRAACHGAAAPCLLACSTCCTQLALMWKQKPSEQLSFAIPWREASLLWMHSTSKKQTYSWERTYIDMHFFHQLGPMDVSGPLDVTLRLVLFQKSLRTQPWGATSMHSLEMSILLAMCQC